MIRPPEADNSRTTHLTACGGKKKTPKGIGGQVREWHVAILEETQQKPGSVRAFVCPEDFALRSLLAIRSGSVRLHVAVQYRSD